MDKGDRRSDVLFFYKVLVFFVLVVGCIIRFEDVGVSWIECDFSFGINKLYDFLIGYLSFGLFMVNLREWGVSDLRR